jgi:hypothetical protein
MWRLAKPRTERWTWSLALVGGASLAAVGQLLGCATEEEILFGEPERVVGSSSVSTSSTSTGGPACVPDPDCEVSFAADLMPLFGDGIGACGAVGCHASDIAGFAFPADATGAYAAITTYVFQGSAPYVVPCEPGDSKLLCNLRVAGTAAPPYGSCGSPMPKASVNDTVSDRPLSSEELALVEAWIICGAPEN